MIRDLGLRLERGGGIDDRIVIPAPAETRGPHGGVRAGILATGVDVVAAGVALRSLSPDWLATTELSLWTREVEQRGPIVGEAHVLRSGRSNAVIEVHLFDAGADDRPVALANATFARIRRSGANAEVRDDDSNERVVVEFAGPDSRLRFPFVEVTGATVVSAPRGIVELQRGEYTINSFGSLQGGMVALLAEVAAEAAASSLCGKAHAVHDLSVRYLESGPRGPYRTETTILREHADHTVARIEIRDSGADHCMAVATATTVQV